MVIGQLYSTVETRKFTLSTLISFWLNKVRNEWPKKYLFCPYKIGIPDEGSDYIEVCANGSPINNLVFHPKMYNGILYIDYIQKLKSSKMSSVIYD